MREVSGDSFSIKAFGMPELVVHINDQTPPVATRGWFHHQIKSELACKFDKPIVAGFGDDQNILDGRLDFGSTWTTLDDC